ncbi:hypothetical protein G3I59_25120 [Amycolatopsis rubida]|uniref:Ester cyclase n=1 Tax=Amycolatopsis rubida TaxID=112413 RepID=A0ABX0BT83_9PSEU|nr:MULTISPECIES: ester cyclase [Amycolatopsis]MYW93801.1 hypothetical protein [Amycolatopsis rubida]NEC58791.1 hypothetical protein [Amycolatopsis rubida]OAP22991.1 SnoaL-like polyketide cyclase [Amycolatopsis sp. M39]
MTVEESLLSNVAGPVPDEWSIAWKALDPERFRPLCAEELRYDDDSVPDPLRGFDRFAEWIGQLRRAFSPWEVKVRRTYTASDGAAVARWWQIRAVHTGLFEPLDLEATGRPVNLDAAEFLECRNGLVVRGRGMFNAVTLLQQVGRLPAE